MTFMKLRLLGSFNPARAKCVSKASPRIPYVFIAVLVYCKVNSSVRTSPYLLLDVILIDPMDSPTIIFTIRIL